MQSKELVPEISKKLLRVQDVCEALSLGRSRVYEEMQAGRLRSVKIGTARRVPVEALEEYLENLQGEA